MSRTKCSPSELAKTYIGFSNQKKALVHEMGFGALAENMSNYNFSNLIMMELVDSFHIPDSTIRTNIGRFKVDATKVGHALELNATGDLRDMVMQIQLNTEKDITNFKRAMNWGRHVYSFLLNGITEMKKKNLKSVDGCVFALLIIYFQETYFGVDSEEADAKPPWLEYWKDNTLKRRIKYDFEDPTPPQHVEADANPAAAIGENVGIIERRIKKMHEAINAAPLQPPRQGEADANPDAAIDALADPSSQVNVNLSSDVEIKNITPLGDTESQEDPTKDADSAAAMGVKRVEEQDTHHDAKWLLLSKLFLLLQWGVESVEEEDTAIVDASIAEPSSVIEETALTDLVEKITNQQHVAPEKNLEESVTRPEEEASEQELTLRDLLEIQKVTLLGDTESQEDPTKDADSAAAMGVKRVEGQDTHHDAVIVDPTIEMAPPKQTVSAAAMGG
ncbi:hypothetical protein PIB30_030624 [Stylosanthes scabra]|uniref:Uncharacterized protein n=1 Tax=Stylosanthes scabra TaxID=79078 RepID=A0ABU6X9A4_9FABA|nr:hypothetical protein [Stylosanthes scabra]